MSVQQIDWDLALIQKYNYSGPRYTSYPTALEFSEDFGEQAFLQAVARYPERPLSLYVHIPFCHKLCYFCGCNKIVTRQQHKADQYLDALEQEIVHRAPLFAGRHVSQLHWGGGTPTYLNKAQISRLMKLLRENFQFNADAEISIEVDPREIELDVLDHLRAEGFNRLSMGVNPDRLSVFNYAHLPTIFAAQRKIKDADLPSPQQKLDILQETIAFLTQSGYQFIGMDHFARPDDELAVAQREGVLHRNFQGYTTQGDTDLLGMGVSAISMIGDCYAQNQKELKQYYQQVDEQGNALWRGIALTRDDCIRRDVIKSLICNFRLDYAPIEKQWDLHFADYFAEDLKLLAPLAKDGLVDVDEKGIQVTAKGRLLIRNICMCFDTYLRQKARMQQFSRVI
ncbi:oxygen-independent coproporphyrinogen III oxidase [Escherichia coli]|uniref:oxygen-independent coproporphyrinogen III oxidase n=1 Tax=Escherichia coli TaxID=562 RepID=UPI0013558879|nr:oxygen-independent coproporphyrinogen III oxidase [Escherichia coli]MVX51231.1 oxygen-independent coproporphyrinogen III oxidase [Escherichia coli]